MSNNTYEINKRDRADASLRFAQMQADAARLRANRQRMPTNLTNASNAAQALDRAKADAKAAGVRNV